jgi:hypothetical protein
VLKFYGKKLVHRINTDGTPAADFFENPPHVVKL